MYHMVRWASGKGTELTPNDGLPFFFQELLNEEKNKQNKRNLWWNCLVQVLRAAWSPAAGSVSGCAITVQDKECLESKDNWQHRVWLKFVCMNPAVSMASSDKFNTLLISCQCVIATFDSSKPRGGRINIACGIWEQKGRCDWGLE